jgi:alkanesulfonate monooxygenase SsuD/methylene tetrahydromethanopterin reductase-like flavin-dependent oxidoreductase (luciferase family)
MVKVILQVLPVLPAESEDDRRSKRPLGRNSEVYQQVLEDWLDLVKAADELGFWGVATIEHHFHSEGYEVGPNPGVMNAYWAAITKNVRIGQLGYVMSAQNPIRVAEETAILDHLTKGRCFVGFARGYQARWTNILGQHLGSKATLSPSGMPAEKLALLSEERKRINEQDDRANREIFEEQVDMVLDAWTKDSIEWNTPHWQVPYPYDDGVYWPMEATNEMGAPGERDENGMIRRVSVVPSPYTKPHPPIFVASNASQSTIEYCGRRGFIPAHFSKIGRAADFGRTYIDHAKSAGRSYTLGQNQALCRWMQVGDSMDDARRAIASYDVDIWRNFYTAMTPMGQGGDVVQEIVDSGLWALGKPNDVRDQFVEQWKQLPAEYFILISHFAQQPKESMIENMAALMNTVKPALDELTQYSDVTSSVAD